MAASNAQRFLASAGVDDELALEMFWGSVYEPFRANTVLFNAADGPDGFGPDELGASIVQSKTIESGKSHQFIYFADQPEPETHTPGTELLGQNFAFDEGTVSIDGILVEHADIPLDHVADSHFDAVGPVGRGMGRKLAENFDKRGFIIAALAALTGSKTKDGYTVHNGGNVIERVNGSGVAAAYPVSPTGAQNFRDDVNQLAQAMDEDNIPEANRYLIYTPYIRRVLQQDTTVFDQTLSIDSGNDYSNRVIAKMAGFNIVSPTNHMPASEFTADSLGGNLPSKYHHDFTYDGGDDGQPVALALCGGDEGKSPIAYLASSHPNLGPIYTYMTVDERKNTLFLKAQMYVGWGKLYVPSAGAIIVDDA
jgi:hypothetical protein